MKSILQRVQWRLVFMLGQTALALGLSVLTPIEQNAHYEEIEKESNAGAATMEHFKVLQSWDYVPTARMLLNEINFPARVMVSPLDALEFPVIISRTGFYLAIAWFWYWVGLALDRKLGSVPLARANRFPRVVVLLFKAVGFLLSVAFAILVLIPASALSIGWFPRFAIELWSIIFAVYFGKGILRRRGILRSTQL